MAHRYFEQNQPSQRSYRLRTSYQIPSLRIGKRTALIIESSNHNEEMRNVPWPPALAGWSVTRKTTVLGDHCRGSGRRASDAAAGARR